MASTYLCALLAIFLAIQSVSADPLGSLLAPIFSPILDVCKQVECGKGTCKPSSNSTFLFECECEPGWKQTSSNHTDHLKFLPCVIPQSCFWSYCGGGSCNKTSKFTYNCECAEGYYNLLNVTALPCFEECAIGMDCANLGISVSNKSAASAPPLADYAENQASSMVQVNSPTLVILMLFAAMLHWK